jgi:hypothetical protein
MHGDDFTWYYAYEFDEVAAWQNPNGRYFTNRITSLIVRYIPLRYVIYTVVLSLLLIITAKLIGDKENINVKYAFVFSLFVLMPSDIYGNVVNWMSGFTNYTISILLTISYMFFCFKLTDKNYIPKKILLIVAVITGFAGALCVESITVYNIIMGISMIFLIYFYRKRIFSFNILYLILSICGTVFMFTSEQYGNIIDESDVLGKRYIEFGVPDIFLQVYMNIIPQYCKKFVAVNVVIAIIVLAQYCQINKENWRVENQRYSKIAVGIVAMFAAYSVFTTCFADLEPLDSNMKIRAIETAFTFLYFVSLIYLSCLLLEKKRKMRTIVYLVSTVVSVAPFLVVNPITSRCFFADYIFWILVAGEFFSQACIDFLNHEYVKKVIYAVAVLLGVFMCNIVITDKYYNNIRIDYIKEQLDSGISTISVIKLPYDDYVYDDIQTINSSEISENDFMSGYSYDELLYMYYGIDVEDKEFDFTYINAVTHSLIQED